MTDALADAALTRAVERVLDDHGWAGATVERIAEAVGVNRVTLYRRGLTRDRLLATAALAAAEAFRAASLPSLTSGGTAEHRLRMLLDALYDLADAHLSLLAGLYDGPTALFHLGVDDPASELITQLEYTDPFERILQDGNADGTLTSTDPRNDSELIFNTAGWTYVHFRRSHRWTSKKAREDVTRVVMAFVLPTVLVRPAEEIRS